MQTLRPRPPLLAKYEDKDSKSTPNIDLSIKRILDQMPVWGRPLLRKSRYKCLWGGRGCIDGDTLIETPNGLTRVADFAGGEVYAFDGIGKSIAIAGRPVKYNPEPLYRVSFSSGQTITTTAQHRFLTEKGWIECGQLDAQHAIVSYSPKSFADPLVSCSFSCQSEWREGALRWLRKLLGFLYGYCEYLHQCGLQPLSQSGTYQDVLLRLADAQPHSSHTSSHLGDQAIAYTRNFSQFLRRLSTEAAQLVEAAKSYAETESCNAGISSELLSVTSLVLQLSQQRTNLHELIQAFSAHLLSACIEAQTSAQTPQTISHILLSDVSDSSYLDNPFKYCCNHNPHYSGRLRVKEVEYIKTECFYDFFVPGFNNYLSEGGIINHNSGKSFTVVDALLSKSVGQHLKLLCAREFQVSIRDSVHSLFSQRIRDLELTDYFEIQRDRIFGPNNSEFMFKGLHHNIDNIKSIPGLTDVWIEEAQSISKHSWDILIPTIRNPGSEIWVTFNPKLEQDVIYQQFIVNPRPNAYIQRANWDDNPYFPDVLDEERRYCQETDPDAYQHIWEGGLWSKSNAQVLSGKWVVRDFTPNKDWGIPYHGADFGFSEDPTTLTKAWEYDDCLWIEYESYQRRLELDDTADRWKKDIPDCERYTIRGDNARPETISYLRRHGIPYIRPCDKGKGSVEDGIAHLRSYRKIIIHPRCKHAAEEALLWSYKVDKHTSEVLPILLKGNDHCFDAIRYSTEELMKAKHLKWLSNL